MDFGNQNDDQGNLIPETEASSVQYGIPNYFYNPSLRFNFKNKKFTIPNCKDVSYLDQIIRDKAKIPSPDKYAHPRQQFNDYKPGKIFTKDRKLFLDDVVK